MGISFECGNCGKPFNVDRALGGKTGRCKQCGRLLFIPLQSTTKPVRTWAEQPSADDSSPSIAASRFEVVESVLPPRAPVANQTSAKPALKKKKKKKGWGKSSGASESGWGAWAGRVGASIAGFLLVLRVLIAIARVFHVGSNWGSGEIAIGGSVTPEQSVRTVQKLAGKYQSGPIALPKFPEVGAGREIEPGVMFHEITLGQLNRPLGSVPGQGGRLWLYLPGKQDDLVRQSLPCILITAAGTRLVHGNELGEGDRPEHLPYVRAGFAVLAFELDGSIPEAPDERALTEGMVRFLAARSGLVNAHVALEYALQKVPAIDPDRISIAGHSSAGTVAVLFAAHESRLKSAVAFAPAVDNEKEVGPEIVSGLQRGGLGDLVVRYSPKYNISTLGCPLYLFHAADDPNVAAEDTRLYADQANNQGKSVTYDLVATGGHHQPMINQGIPHAIAWLKGESIPTSSPPQNLARNQNPDRNPNPAPGRNRSSHVSSRTETRTVNGVQTQTHTETRTVNGVQTQTHTETSSGTPAGPGAAAINDIRARNRERLEAIQRQRDQRRQQRFGAGP